VASYAYQFNVVNRTGRLIGATTRFGDEDVGDFFHHSPNVRGGWITIRDHKLNLYYFGWVEAFSDSGKERELLLREVSVHDNSSGDCIYKTDALYLSRKQDDLTLEVTLVSNNLQKPTIELTEADAPDRMDVEDKASIESTSDPREEGVGHEKSKSR
jgi:putative heme degradation protein